MLLNNRLAIVCPNPSTYLKFVETQVPRDQLYESIWYVDRGSFYTCRVGIPKNQGVNKRWMNCDTPSALKYGWLSFTSLNAENDFSFVAGTEHYFIGELLDRMCVRFDFSKVTSIRECKAVWRKLDNYHDDDDCFHYN